MEKPIILAAAPAAAGDDNDDDDGIPEETWVKGKDGGGSSTHPLADTTTPPGLPTPGWGLLYNIIPGGMPLGKEPCWRVMRGWEETCGSVGVLVVGNTDVVCVGEAVVAGDVPITHPETESGISLLLTPPPTGLVPLDHPAETDRGTDAKVSGGQVWDMCDVTMEAVVVWEV